LITPQRHFHPHGRFRFVGSLSTQEKKSAAYRPAESGVVRGDDPGGRPGYA
jgi:hypothetical protein